MKIRLELGSILFLCLRFLLTNLNGQSTNQAVFQQNFLKAQNGDPVAQESVASAYYKGCVVKKDYVEAVKWYRMSAEHGWAMAQYYLGLCYADGKGLPQDYEQAVHWYRKAAEQGFSDAEESLGACYANGKAVIDVQDAVEVYKWVKIAEEKGFAGAAKTVAVISALLSPEELREADRRYQELVSRKNWLYDRVRKIIVYNANGTFQVNRFSPEIKHPGRPIAQDLEKARVVFDVQEFKFPAAQAEVCQPCF